MGQTNVKMGTLVKALIPFLVAVSVALVLIAAVPEISTWLPAKLIK